MSCHFVTHNTHAYKIISIVPQLNCLDFTSTLVVLNRFHLCGLSLTLHQKLEPIWTKHYLDGILRNNGELGHDSGSQNDRINITRFRCCDSVLFYVTVTPWCFSQHQGSRLNVQLPSSRPCNPWPTKAPFFLKRDAMMLFFDLQISKKNGIVLKQFW